MEHIDHIEDVDVVGSYIHDDDGISYGVDSHALDDVSMDDIIAQAIRDSM